MRTLKHNQQKQQQNVNKNAKGREKSTDDEGVQPVQMVPHHGSLSRVEDKLDCYYVIEICYSDHVMRDGVCNEIPGTHELVYTRNDFDFSQRLFAILDSENRGVVSRDVVLSFVTLRCPVFWRRDDDLRKLRLAQQNDNTDIDLPVSTTFDEIWDAVAKCSKNKEAENKVDLDKSAKNNAESQSTYKIELGIEGWMVFCRFVALAQYLEARRRFSARHLQQTMRHRNSPRGSEVVVVEVPPLEPPTALSSEQLVSYERKSKAPLPIPELDLDHSLVSAHDTASHRTDENAKTASAKVELFGNHYNSAVSSKSSAISSSSSQLDFAVTYRETSGLDGEDNSREDVKIVVRRSLSDMKWLDDTFVSHKELGGTLCGRILPPFPGSSRSRSHISSFVPEATVSTSALISSAETINGQVGRLTNVAKSLIGSYWSSSPTIVPETKQVAPRKRPTTTRSIAESYYNINSPECKARHLEKYLNYLLKHPALSTSFPLNAVLQASQSGLEAAKQALDECTKQSREMKKQTPHIEDGKMCIPFLPASSQCGLTIPWVRTAAQAAMALRVHGLLESTGLNSASARLQHASLPNFDGASRGSIWGDEGTDIPPTTASHNDTLDAPDEACDFEEGVTSVKSKLHTDDIDDGDNYDLLPLPVPAPERRILSAGNEHRVCSGNTSSSKVRFNYGSEGDMLRNNLLYATEDDNYSLAYLGDMAIDDNIDKLREVIGSVGDTLSRCLSSLGTIGSAQAEKQSLHLNVLKGLDDWEGLRGKFVSQKSLLKGVEGVSQSKEIIDESNLGLTDDISWQTSLASAAVTAAEDVRAAVRIFRTAANAKAAANSALMTAQNSCTNGNFSTIDEARAAQTRASIARSHAIHAAVVEHEAKTMKRRVTLALGHDVKCWNVHRKAELFRGCLAYAQSQQLASKRAVEAWSTLRDGFLDVPVIPLAPGKHRGTAKVVNTIPVAMPSIMERVVSDDEVHATIYDETILSSSPNVTSIASIVAVEHMALRTSSLSGDKSDTMPALAHNTSTASSTTAENRDMQDEVDAHQNQINGSDSIEQFEAAHDTHSDFFSEPHDESGMRFEDAVESNDGHADDDMDEVDLDNIFGMNNDRNASDDDVIVDDNDIFGDGNDWPLYNSYMSNRGLNSVTSLTRQSQQRSLEESSTSARSVINNEPTSASIATNSRAFAEQATETCSADDSINNTNDNVDEKSSSMTDVYGWGELIGDDLVLPFATAEPVYDQTLAGSVVTTGSIIADPSTSHMSSSSSHRNVSEGNEIMSASMQSLVDGLMTWGGWDTEDDHFNLPAGMAASIVMEESGIFDEAFRRDHE